MRSPSIVLLVLAASCASAPPPKTDAACVDPSATKTAGAGPAATASLYERLGGKPAIEAVIDAFLGEVAQDARINHFFAGANVPALRGHLVDQVCAASGGPCTYTGRDMKSVHAGMGVDDAAFGALVEDLIKAMKRLDVPAREQGELLAVLGPMKADIVAK